MIGHYVPENDEHWMHYIELLDIMDLIFSPTVHPNMPGYLEENLEMFVTLYGGASIIPKMHFLIHVPRLLERQVIIYVHTFIPLNPHVDESFILCRFGPLVRFWTMRFEAKHQYFKSLASRMGNFINITYSLALRQQCYQCYVLQSQSGFCAKHLKVGKGIFIIYNWSIKMCMYIYIIKCVYIGNSVSVGETVFKDPLLSFTVTEGDTVFW